MVFCCELSGYLPPSRNVFPCVWVASQTEPEMLAFSRASVTWSHFEIIIRKPLLVCVGTLKLPVLRNLCMLWRTRLVPYHSMNSPSMGKVPIPRNDYTVDGNVARSNWLITKLSREGKIGEARRVFDEMPNRDVVTWTTVISGYIKCGMMEEARKMFDRAAAEKNVVTWTAMVSGYIRLNKIYEAEKLFNEMPHKNVVSWNTMIDGYAQNGQVDSALYLFEQMPERNVVSWNTVITALAQCGRIEEAMRLFDHMPKRDVISWTAMISGLSKNGRIDEARLLFDRMPDRNVVSWNAMVTGYAQNLRLDEAFDLFERMPERDLPSWNTMITGFIQNGDLRRASELFYEMPQKNVVSWTTMVTGYVQDGQNEEALQIFSRMLAAEGVKPNEGTFVSVLGACSNLAGLSEGQQVHQRIIKTVYQDRAFVISALINMYSKCGEIEIARKIFDHGLSFQRDLISWSGMIAAYAHHGCGKEAISLFEKMRPLGFKPDDVTYVGLLSACSHAGLVEEGLKYFDELTADRSIKVREDHYACLVDLCGRAGRLKEALGFIERLGTMPSASVWGALLAGCNVHANTDIGKMAAKKIIELEPENTGTYMLLSNIYASTGKWREASKVRLKMKEDGLKKQPGCSWIEVGNRVHIFVVGVQEKATINSSRIIIRENASSVFIVVICGDLKLAGELFLKLYIQLKSLRLYSPDSLLKTKKIHFQRNMGECILFRADGEVVKCQRMGSSTSNMENTSNLQNYKSSPGMNYVQSRRKSLLYTFLRLMFLRASLYPQKEHPDREITADNTYHTEAKNSFC